MIDKRLVALAKILVRDCLTVKKLDKILIKTTSPLGIPLVKEVYRQLLVEGAIVKTEVGIEELDKIFYQTASQNQLDFYPSFSEMEAIYFDKFLYVVADQNIRSNSQVDQNKLLARMKLTHKVKQIILKKKWTLTYFPTSSMAQEALMDTDSFEDFFFQTTNQEWLKNKDYFQKIIKKLQDKKLRIVGEKTNLSLQTKGRTWIDNDYISNMPGGEVFTSPIKESINGEIYFNYPLTYNGQTINDILLKFENGKIVDFETSRNYDVLAKVINLDQFSSYVGEIAFGLNKGCSFYLNNILFDEKMDGTIHLALGNSFPECGGDHESAIHLDIIKNMKTESSMVYANDQLIYQNGQFVFN